MNDIPLNYTGGGKENGRFTLYPTNNIYNFILLDQIDGRMWQVQWSLKEKNRGLIPIDEKQSREEQSKEEEPQQIDEVYR